MEMTNRTSFSPTFPYRERRPISNKLIFIVCEGAATENDYFKKVVSREFDNIKTKVQIINIFSEILQTPPKYRTPEMEKILCSSNPKNLLEEMNNFVAKKEQIYEFSKHDDEFWIVMDIDKHTAKELIDDWNQVLDECDKKKYNYAISNPFFELWLLLHHDNVNDDDFKFAVTENNPYKRNSHFRERLRNLGASLQNQKHIKNSNIYTKQNIQKAVERAKLLDKSNERYPTNLGSTMYKLMQLMLTYDNNSE